MADLASSAVTVVKRWTEGATNGRKRVVRVLDIALTNQGGATNKITAKAMGFSSIEECSNALDKTGTKIIPAVVNAAGDAVLLTAPTAASVTLMCTPTDSNAITIRITVKGH